VDYDVDKVKIRDLPVRCLPNLCYGIADLCWKAPDEHETGVDFGACTVCSRVAVYVDSDMKQALREMLADSKPYTKTMSV